MNNVNPILFHYNLDENGNPKSVIINGEQSQASVLHYSVQLKQTPDELHNIVVMDNLNNKLTQVDEMEDITENTYYVDYKNALVYFHPTKAGKTFIFNYAGIGWELISCSRIYDTKDVNGQTVVKTLQDIIDKGRECIDALSIVGNAVQVLKKLENYIVEGTELANNLNGKINTGNQLVIDLTSKITQGTTLSTDLGNKISTGGTLNTDLGTKITTGTTLKNDLTTKITEGNTTKTNLDASNTDAKQTLANINVTGNGTYTIPSAAWTGTVPNLTYILNHNMNSKNLIVNVIDTVTQKSIFSDFRVIDANNIEMQSMEACSITVTINARYYSGKDANTVQQEIIDARKGEINLNNRLNGIDLTVNNKVTKVEGKGLSTNDYTTLEQSEVAKIKDKANNVDINRNTVAKDVTGAINEINTKSEIIRGTNANGMYVRYSDGTQICTKTVSITVVVNTPSGSMFSSEYGSNLGDFSKPFAGTSEDVFITGCITSGGGSHAFNSQLYNTTTTNAGAIFLFRSVAAPSLTYKFTYQAIGRWK